VVQNHPLSIQPLSPSYQILMILEEIPSYPVAFCNLFICLVTKSSFIGLKNNLCLFVLFVSTLFILGWVLSILMFFVNDPKGVTEIFNIFFVNVAKDIGDKNIKIDKTHPSINKVETNRTNKHKLFFKPINEDFVTVG
jgi:hypothetical protein